MSVTLHGLPADKPMTLVEACEKVFGGAITVASLMAESKRGNLSISKIGRAYFVTLNDINEMIEKCRVKQEAPISGSMKPVVGGRSATAQSASALAALKIKLKKPAKP